MLTINQRLLIIDVSTMEITGSCDLLDWELVRYDLHAQHLRNYSAVAASFAQSFYTYKSKVFVLVIITHSDIV